MLYTELFYAITPTFFSYTLQKWKVCFNSSRIISVAASLPNNVNTSKSIILLVHYRSPLQFQKCRQVNN